MKINLSSLTLEITRRCNMKCEHCLRGMAQKVDMDFEIINKLTQQTDKIYSLTLTGGEPSLNADAIGHLRHAMYFHCCELGNFWLTTNARFFKPDFYDEIQWLYGVCSEKEACVLTISGDQFHTHHSNVAYEKYWELPFFSNERMSDIPYERILDEGYARKNNYGSYERNPTTKLYDTHYISDDDELYVGDLIYVNAKGDVLLDCDLSYANQRKYAVGNILKSNLRDILLKLMDENVSTVA